MAIINFLAYLLAWRFHKIYKATLHSRFSTHGWKTRALVAVHRGGSRSDLETRRQVSLAGVFHEVVENIISGKFPNLASTAFGT